MLKDNVFLLNAFRVLRPLRGTDVRIDEVLALLEREHFSAGLETFLANPFIQTALKILKSFNKNYKIEQAVRLLEEAGKEEQETQRKSRKRR